MAHLDDATALAFAAGGLSGADLEAALAHVDTCADCRRAIAGVARTAGGAVDDAAAAEAAHPTAIGRFAIDGVAGRGAMGVVYRARDPRLERPVAIKMLRGDAFAGDARARFEREARALARIDHPNVVKVYEVGEHDGALYLAMELVAGPTVDEWLAAAPRRPTEILAVFRAAGQGLLAAHQAGLVHRDFKPANAMLGDDGRVRVTDFGLVHHGDAAATLGATPAGPVDILTRTGALVGTPAYLAPELLAAALDGDGARAGDRERLGVPEPRSDQFSFCVALYEALAGHRPFVATDLRGLAAAIERGPTPPRRPIARRVLRALRRGLARAPADRFPSMAELVAAIAPPRRAPWLVGGALVAAGALATTAWAWPRPAPIPAAAGACPAADARWASLWTATDRRAVRAAMIAAWPARPPADVRPELAARWDGLGRVRALLLVDQVDRLGERWRSSYREVCTGKQAEVQRRRACLDDLARRIAALVAAPGAGLGDELNVLDGDLERCAVHLVAGLELPAEEVAPRVERARDDLARAAADRARGALSAAAAAADRAIALGTEVASPQVLAEAWLERGLIARDAGEVQASLDAWHTALGFAQQLGHHRLLRRTADELAAQYALGAGAVAEAERWLRTAAALDGKVPPTDAERAVRALAQAALARQAGNRDGARVLLDEARRLAGPIGSPLAARVAAAQAALAAP